MPPDGDDPPPGSLWAGVPLFEDDPPPAKPHPVAAPTQRASNLPPPSSPPSPPPDTPSAQPSPWPSPPSSPAPDQWPAPPSSSVSTPSPSIPAWTEHAPTGGQRRRLWPVLLAVFVAFDLLAAAGIFAVISTSGGGDDGDAASRSPGIEQPSAPASPEKEASRGGNEERPSLLSPTGMRRALKEVKRKLGSDVQLQSIRVERESFQAIARDKLVMVKRDGSSDVLPGPPTIVAPFPIEAIDPGAPSRIEQSFVSTGKKLFYTILTGLNYKGGVQWITFASDARNSGYRSDRSGRGLCRLEKRC